MSTLDIQVKDEGYKPSDNEEYMNERQLAYFRKKADSLERRYSAWLERDREYHAERN